MYFIQFSMTQDERKGLILCLKIEFSDGLWGGYSFPYVEHNQHISDNEVKKAWKFFEMARKLGE